jgi:hypothetical protein
LSSLCPDINNSMVLTIQYMPCGTLSSKLSILRPLVAACVNLYSAQNRNHSILPFLKELL